MGRELRAWVAWLVNRYRLALKIPVCWPQRGKLVEELTALWYAWRTAWITPPQPGASGWEPTRLHDYKASLRRIADDHPVPCSTDHISTSGTNRVAGLVLIDWASWVSMADDCGR